VYVKREDQKSTRAMMLPAAGGENTPLLANKRRAIISADMKAKDNMVGDRDNYEGASSFFPSTF
jgi:hypothetical protein